MAETVVNELSNHWVQMDFADNNGDPETPATITWNVGDAIDGTVLATGTETSSSQVTFVVPFAANAIRHNNAYERRKLHVLATYSTGQLHSEVSWLVKNLGFINST